MLSEETSEKIQILRGFTYMTDQSSNSREQKVEQWMPEAGGKGTKELLYVYKSTYKSTMESQLSKLIKILTDLLYNTILIINNGASPVAQE